MQSSGRIYVLWICLILLPSCKEDGGSRPEEQSRFSVNSQALEASVGESLAQKITSDSYSYFRFLNRQWAQSVCEFFARTNSQLEMINLHGDAHLEQYAFTDTEHGLDDFDDAATGPAPVDLVRFISSIDLTCRKLGWSSFRNQLIRTFFEAYEEGLLEPTSENPAPSFVLRLRLVRQRSKSEFLDWADSLMIPLTPQELELTMKAAERFIEKMQNSRPDLPPHFFNLKKIGRLKLGIGSFLVPKSLARVEGYTFDSSDDLILEGKQLSDLSSVPCLSIPELPDTLRVLIGAHLMGRLNHEILGYVPKAEADSEDEPSWWVRSWEPSYQELVIEDLNTPKELSEVIYDCGMQLGQGHVRTLNGPVDEELRLNLLGSMESVQGPVTEVALRFVEEMLIAWQSEQ